MLVRLILQRWEGDEYRHTFFISQRPRVFKISIEWLKNITISGGRVVPNVSVLDTQRFACNVVCRVLMVKERPASPRECYVLLDCTYLGFLHHDSNSCGGRSNTTLSSTKRHLHNSFPERRRVPKKRSTNVPEPLNPQLTITKPCDGGTDSGRGMPCFLATPSGNSFLYVGA